MRRYSQPLLDFLGNGGKLQKRTSIHWYSYFGKRFGPGRRTSARLPASYFGSLHCSSRPMVGWGRDDVKIEDAKMKKSEDWEVSKGRPIPNHKLKSFIHMFFFSYLFMILFHFSNHRVVSHSHLSDALEVYQCFDAWAATQKCQRAAFETAESWW